jgi:hypothetical protein
LYRQGTPGGPIVVSDRNHVAELALVTSEELGSEGVLRKRWVSDADESSLPT